MDFRVGDPVMHWMYGLGEVVRIEERMLSGQKALYYAIQVRDLTIWVPANDQANTRLRRPIPAREFEKLLSLLSAPGEPLPDDRQERKLQIQARLKDGLVESLCRVIRDLHAYQAQIRPLNDNDQALLKRSQNILLGEWAHALSVTPAQAEQELHRRLAEIPAGLKPRQEGKPSHVPG
jgi:RNA polymerase-interacting CarD/CdnL/TRCF family regulator